MSWFDLLVLGAAGIGAMRAAIDRGDIDEAARQGQLAGSVVVEHALAAGDRPAQLAAIAAAPTTADRAELLVVLARLAGGGDRRTALPAARAARTIAREFTTRDLPDDIAGEDVAGWRHTWFELARDRDRWIELRVIALDVAAHLDRAVPPSSAPALDLVPLLGEPDAAIRRAAIAVLPAPIPAAVREPLADVVAKDTDESVALAAAAALCADLVLDPPAPIITALGPAGLERIKSLVTGRGSRVLHRDAARCLKR